MSKTINFHSLLNKANSHKTAEGFISAYREKLETLSSNDVLLKLDNNKITFDEALYEIKNILFLHIAEQSKNNLVSSAKSSGRKKKYKNITVLFLDTDDNVLDEYGCDLLQDAQRWSYNALFNSAPGSYCKVIHNKANFTDIVSREDAFYNKLKRNKSPFMKRMGVSGGLKSTMKVKETIVNFSQG